MTEHTHKVEYRTPNTIGLVSPEPYINVIAGLRVIINVTECRKAGCRKGGK